MKYEDGGDAFAAENGHMRGMSVRIWLAGQAVKSSWLIMGNPEDIAKQCLQIADEIIRQDLLDEKRKQMRPYR